MNLQDLWRQKRYSDIVKITLERKSESIPAEDLLICAESLLKMGYRQNAMSFFGEAKIRNCAFPDRSSFHYARLLFDDGDPEKAYECLCRCPCGSFDEKLLLYQLKKTLGSSEEELIALLNELNEISYQEDLLYDIAFLYYKRGEVGRGRRVCRQLISYFGSGQWVQSAQALMDDPKGVLERNGTLPAGSKPGKEIPSAKIPSKAVPQKAMTPTGMTLAAAPGPGKSAETKEYPDIINEAFQGMIGMESVKDELLGFYNVIRLQKMREKNLGVVDSGVRSYNFVLYGNPGTGKTTVARIIAKVLYALGIRDSDKFSETDRSKLVGQYIGETAQKTKGVIDKIRGGTLFIDEAYSLMAKDNEKDFGKEAVDTLLKDMEDNRDSYSVIMAGYKEPMRQMLKMNPGFQSRINYHINIPDYSDDELIKIARKIAAAKLYSIDKSGEKAVRKCIAKARVDETFGNARFIRELIDKAEINMANRLSTASGIHPSEMMAFTGEDFLPDEPEELSEQELLDELNSLTGLSSVKGMVNNLLASIRVRKEAERRGIPMNDGMGTLHMTFRGNPGTGKTTVARILGRLLNQMGILKRGDIFVECSRAELVGQHQGHTAQKVKDVVANAMGGILFIDEAYSLVKKPDDSFGLEAVDTLIAEMENRKNDFIVILAGYSDPLDKFLASNPGFSSRIAINLTFEDYTTDEMTDIFYGIAEKNHIRIDHKLRTLICNVLTDLSRKTDFGNARGVRNAFEFACRRKDARVAEMLQKGELVSNETLVSLTADDISQIGVMLGGE